MGDAPAVATPSITDTVIDWLQHDLRLVDVLGSTRRIGDRMPAAHNQVFVAVVRAGGAGALVRGWARESRLTVNVWGTTAETSGRTSAETAAEEARRSVEDLTGRTWGELVFAAVDVLGDLTWLPDTTYLPQRARYIFQFRAICHPTSTST